MSTVTCNALFGDWSVPPSETRGPLNMSKGSEAIGFNRVITSSALLMPGETKAPVGRLSMTDI
jgi:hypothetical protein